MPLGTTAEIKLPEGYAFIGPESLDRFFELTRNYRSGNEVGAEEPFDRKIRLCCLVGSGRSTPRRFPGLRDRDGR